MKRSLIVIAGLGLMVATAFAQSPQRPSDDELNMRLQALANQRNAAQDQVAVLSAAAEAQRVKMQAEIEALKKAACSPKKDEAKKVDK